MGDTLVGNTGPLYQLAPETVRDDTFETDLPAAQDILKPLNPLTIGYEFSIPRAVRFTRQLEREGCDKVTAIMVGSRLAGVEIDWVEFDKEHGITPEGDK